MRKEAYAVRIVGRTSPLTAEGKVNIVEAKFCIVGEDVVQTLKKALTVVPGVVDVFSVSMEKTVVVDGLDLGEVSN